MYTHEGVVVSVYVNMFVSLSMGDKRLMSHPMKISHSLSLSYSALVMEREKTYRPITKKRKQREKK